MIPRGVVNVLAVVGGLTLLSSAAGFVLSRYADGTGTGVVLGPGNKPLAGAPVFLDRGSSAIERYVTDAQGRFALPVEKHEWPRAQWLICAPGGIPMVDQVGGTGIKLGPTTYGFTPQKPGEGAFIRSYGWHGPVPRECPRASDSTGWRYPASAGKHPSAFSLLEPDWAAYP